MSFLSLFRIAKLGFQSFIRNRLLSVAAILVMTTTLLIIYIFAVLNLGLSQFTNTLQGTIDLVVYFKTDALEADISALKQRLSTDGSVKLVTLVSKEEALARLLKDHPEQKRTYDAVGTNPLPPSLEIKVDPPRDIARVRDIVNSPEYLPLLSDKKSDSYADTKDTIDKLLGFIKFVKTTGIATSVFFVLVSFLVVFNTVKLTTFTRREEIEIMRLVGATESFVRLPFVFEGSLYAFFGSILATGGLVLILHSFANSIAGVIQMPVASVDKMAQLVDVKVWLVFLAGLGISGLISTTCSYLAVRRSL